MIVGMRTDEHSLRSQVGIGSESDCLLGQLQKLYGDDQNTMLCNNAL